MQKGEDKEIKFEDEKKVPSKATLIYYDDDSDNDDNVDNGVKINLNSMIKEKKLDLSEMIKEKKLNLSDMIKEKKKEEESCGCLSESIIDKKEEEEESCGCDTKYGEEYDEAYE